MPVADNPSCERSITLQRKGSSFLEEPVTNKMTERGEADISIGDNAASNGLDGHDDIANSKVRYAVSEMQGWRSHMEDKHMLNPTLSSSRQQAQLLKDHHLFAVFDGHGGDFASHFCGEHLAETLIQQKDWLSYLRLSDKAGVSRNTRRKSVTGLHLLKSALTSTFLQLDEKLVVAQRERRLNQLSQLESIVLSLGGDNQHDVFQKGTKYHNKIMNFDKIIPSMPATVQLERSGSTGVVVLVTPHHFICANAGDSRAILSKRNGVLPLSFDHKPCNDIEVTRVERDGGFVRVGRVDGDLAVSRSFGDFGYKNVSTDKSTSRSCEPQDHKVTVYPDIIVHSRDPGMDEFIVLACDGIWDRLTNKDCSDLVHTLIHHEGETDVGLICEEMIDTSLELDSRDNMTCMLAVFPAANMGKEDKMSIAPVGKPLQGVMKRRQSRERTWGNESTPAKRAQLRLEEHRKKYCEMRALQKAAAQNTQSKVEVRGRTVKLEKRRRSKTPESRRRSKTPLGGHKTPVGRRTPQSSAPVGLRIVQGNLKPVLAASGVTVAEMKHKAPNRSRSRSTTGAKTRHNKSLRV